MATIFNILGMHEAQERNEYVQRMTGTAGSLPPMGVETGAAYLSRKIAEARAKIDAHPDYARLVAEWQSYVVWASGHLERLCNPPELRTAAERELWGIA